jgi:hypothetical protein
MPACVNLAGSLVAMWLFFWFILRLAKPDSRPREDFDPGSMSVSWLMGKGYGRRTR